MLALAVLLCVCLLVLSWRFLLLHRREMARRIKVDYQQKILLDAALENMSQGLCMFDADGRIVLFNERYAKMMGLPAAWLKGRSLLDLFSRKERESLPAIRKSFSPA